MDNKIKLALIGKYRLRRIVFTIITLVSVGIYLFSTPASYETIYTGPGSSPQDATSALSLLQKLEVKGRAPKTGYKRTEFYHGWPTIDGCSLRQRIIKRELGDSAKLDGCNVISGEFEEPYTGEYRTYHDRSAIAKGLQIDHVVALSNAWQTGAQYKEQSVRYQIATDPLNLLAVDGPANEQKSDADAATWLPANKKFRCAYVARQVSVKYKYKLWITAPEKTAIEKVLANCPNEPAPGL